ncbi:MAG: hypothetical protein WBC78_17240 [Candidatus Sulfotelmatobacter sp.]
MFRSFPICVAMAMMCLFVACEAQEIRVPASATAGEKTSISTTGNGKATFYLIGPGVSSKREVSLGAEILLQAQDLRNAGEYIAVLCSGECHNASFFVSAGKPHSLTFLVHPSRVPVAQNDAVSGVALPFDQFRNLVTTPETINFQLTAGNASLLSRSVRTQDGISWFRTASGNSAGPLQVVASLDDVSTRRAVQQVASDPCDLRIKGERTATGILVETEPVRDCAGNPVPDGTIVTFTATVGDEKSTVDAPIKQDVARAKIVGSGPAVISAASGVVMGNELRVGVRP